MTRVLLARRLPEAQDGVARHISDRVALAPTGPQDLAALFDRALARGGLDAGEDALEESLRLSEKRIDRLEQAAPRAAERWTWPVYRAG